MTSLSRSFFRSMSGGYLTTGIKAMSNKIRWHSVRSDQFIECKMAKKFHYFNLNGLGEAIRYILHYNGEKFEDIRIERPDWPIKSIKDSLPYGQFPLYEEDGKSLNQSIAIARYLAAKSDLLPSDLWEQARMDAVVLTLYDFWEKARLALFEPDPAKKAVNKQQFFEVHIPYYFSRLEKELKAGNGYFGGKLTWADIVFVGMIEAAQLFFKTEIEKDYPTIAALLPKVRSLPGIKEYIANRVPYVSPPYSD